MKPRTPEEGRALLAAVQRNEREAVERAEKLLHDEKPFEGARDLAFHVVASTALHRYPSLVLYAMRWLATLDDEAAFRAIVPLAPRSWDGGWLDYGGSPVAARAHLTADYLEAHPELGDDDENDRIGEMIGDVFEVADASTKARLRAIAHRFYREAAASWVRIGCARAIVRDMGERDFVWTLVDAEDRELCDAGLALAFDVDRAELVRRYGHLVDPDRHANAEDAMRRDLLQLLMKRQPLAMVGDGKRIAFAWGDGRRITYGAFTPGAPALATHSHVLKAPSYAVLRELSITFPKKFHGAVTAVFYRVNSGDTGTVYLHEDEKGKPLAAKTQTEVLAQLGRKVPAKAPAQEKSRATKPAKPVKEAKPKPAPRYVVKTIGQQASSSQGKIQVAGEDLVALFDGATGAKLFAPANAIALAVTDRHVLAWCMTKRAGGSGIARGDYDWTLERYTWPGKALVSRYTLTSRKVIEWCWPLGLRCAKSHGYRIAAFDCRSEDWKDCIYVVMHDDGTFSETQKLDEAVRIKDGG